VRVRVVVGEDMSLKQSPGSQRQTTEGGPSLVFHPGEMATGSQGVKTLPEKVVSWLHSERLLGRLFGQSAEKRRDRIVIDPVAHNWEEPTARRVSALGCDGKEQCGDDARNDQAASPAVEGP
jgi:hypothetical protein